MMIADIDTVLWEDPWVQGLAPIDKLLFLYFLSNPHKNVAGLYVITHKTISHETGMTSGEVKKSLESLYPKVLYDDEEHIVWVVNHVRRTYLRSSKVSPKIKKAIERNILQLPEGHRFIGEFLRKYRVLDIPYPYSIEEVSEGYVYPPGSGTGSGIGSGKNEDKEKEVQNGCLLVGHEPDWSAELEVLKSIPGYPYSEKKDRKRLAEKAEEFSEIDILSLLKGWKVYLEDRPLTSKSNPRSQLINQFAVARRFGFHRKTAESERNAGELEEIDRLTRQKAEEGW